MKEQTYEEKIDGYIQACKANLKKYQEANDKAAIQACESMIAQFTKMIEANND